MAHAAMRLPPALRGTSSYGFAAAPPAVPPSRPLTAWAALRRGTGTVGAATLCLSTVSFFPGGGGSNSVGTCGMAAQAAVVRRRQRGAAAAAQKQQFSSFEDMLGRSEVPVLVDFYATWCGPCQMMSPVLSSVATRLKGRLQVVKIDTDKYPRVASKHRVQALPTLALFAGGKLLFRAEGALSEAQLMERLDYFLTPLAAKGGSVGVAEGPSAEGGGGA